MKKPQVRTIHQKFFLLSVSVFLIWSIIQTFGYTRISASTRKLVDQYSSSVVQQVAYSIEEVLEEARLVGYYFSYGKTVTSFLTPTEDFDFYQQWNVWNDKASTAVQTNRYLKDIAVYRTDGRLRYQYNPNDLDMRSILDRYETILTQEKRSAFFTLLDNPGRRPYIAYVQPVISTDYPTFGKRTGTILVVLEQGILEGILQNIDTNDSSRYYLIDKDGSSIASTTRENFDLEELVKKPSTLTEDIGDTGWKLVCDIDIQNSMKSYSFFSGFTLLTAVLMFLLLLSTLRIINSSIVRPISRLTGEIEKIRDGDFKKRINVSDDNELGNIAKTVNRLLDWQDDMAHRIITTQQELYEAELSRSASERQMLESQINPHFLLNTMQCICGIAVSCHAPIIVNIVTNLSGIFTYALRENEIVPLSKEMQSIQNYLEIMQIRFAGAFECEIDVPPGLMRQKMTKMILQPLVENAVYHGLEKAGRGTLRVTAREQDACLLVDIWNNGVPIPPEKLEKLQKILGNKSALQTESIRHKKIGIANTCWRIKLIFGDEYGLSIDSSAENGTLVSLRVPRIDLEEEENRLSFL